MAKRNMNGGGLLLGLAVGSGLYLYSRKSPASTGEGTTDGTSVPAWVPGPGNLGRIYGVLDIDPEPDFFAGHQLSADPACGWVVEGDRFLPVGDAIEYPASAPTLEASISVPTGTAWGYVAKLIDEDKLTPDQVARRLLNDSGHDGTCAVVTTGAVYRWLADTSERVAGWLASRPPVKPPRMRGPAMRGPNPGGLR